MNTRSKNAYAIIKEKPQKKSEETRKSQTDGGLQAKGRDSSRPGRLRGEGGGMQERVKSGAGTEKARQPFIPPAGETGRRESREYIFHADR